MKDFSQILIDELRTNEGEISARPEFADYPAMAGRVIPVITLEPVPDAD